MKNQTLIEDEKHIYKNRIITQLYKSGEVQKKIEGICYRNFIKPETRINEDIVQETFFWLSKKTSDEIIEMYEDNPKRLLGLAVRIAVWKGVSKKKSSNNPKHSLAQYLLFTSNYQQMDNINPTDNFEDGDVHNIHLIDKDSEVDNEKLMWETIRENLTQDENEFLEYVLSHKRKGGHFKKEKEQYSNLLKRIEEIIIDNNFII